MEDFIDLPNDVLSPIVQQKELTGHLTIQYNNSDKKVKIIIKDKEGKLNFEQLYLQIDMIASFFEIDYEPKQVDFNIKEEKSSTIMIISFFKE